MLTRNMDKQSESYIPPPQDPLQGVGGELVWEGFIHLIFLCKIKKRGDPRLVSMVRVFRTYKPQSIL